MTDITDRATRDMLEWARIAFASKGNQEHEPWVTAARYILDNVDAPALSDDLANITENWETWTTDTITGALTAATTRAEQIEQERDEARDEVERLTEALKQLSERVTTRVAMPPGDIPGTALPINVMTVAHDPTTPSPADVRPGEAWLVEVNGKRGTAVKDGGGLAPWSVVINGVFTSRCDEFITLVARLVPEPRIVRYEPKEK